MNILLVNKYYHVTGGPERYMFNIIEILERRGHKVVPISLRSSKNKKSKYEKYFLDSPLKGEGTHYVENGLTVIDKLRLMVNAIYSFSANKKIKEVIKRESIDLVYLLNICNYISPSVIDAANELDVKVVMRLSDYNFICSSYMFYRDGGPCSKCFDSVRFALKYRCMKNSLALSITRVMSIKIHLIMGIYKKVDSFVAPSTFMAKSLEKFGIEKNKINYIPSFINPKIYTPNYGRGKYALYFGRLSADKGVDLIITAWHILGDKAPQLMIVGGGEEEHKLREKVSSYQLKNIVFISFTSSQIELQKIITDSKFVIIPSLGEDNSPMTTYEAMACGKPVIASEIGGLVDQVIHGDTGFLFPWGDYQKLAEQVLKLNESDALIEKLGRSARKRLETEFSTDKHLEKLLRLFSTS